MNCFENTDLITTVDLSNTDYDKKQVFQIVYGTQLYTTLLGVYARFDVADTGTPNERLLKSVTLKLLNYQGPTCLGFFGPISYQGQIGANPKEILFGLRGVNEECSSSLEFPSGVVIKKGERIVFKRTLYPLEGYKVNLPIDTDNPTKDTIPPGPVFESEFYFRNGLDVYNRALLPGMYQFQGKSNIMFPSARCHASIVSFTF